MKIAAMIVGIAIAAAGGVIAYRAAFLEPHAAIVITSRDVDEIPNIARVAVGLLLLVAGAAIAFFSARKRGQ